MRSMTGFGRAQRDVDGVSAVCEVKTLNHKGLDVKIRLPRESAALESQVLSRVKTSLERGRVDVAVEVSGVSAQGADVAWAAHLLQNAREVARAAGIVGELSPAEALAALLAAQRREQPELPVQAVAHAILSAVDDALARVVESRLTEGAALAQTLVSRLEVIADIRTHVAIRTADAPARLAARLKARLDTALGERGESIELESVRLAQEVALLAERVDVTEELERLGAHIDLARSLIAATSPGRKLEFLCQEFLREANTLGSKCQDAPTAHLVVSLKTEIERLREQVQNAE